MLTMAAGSGWDGLLLMLGGLGVGSLLLALAEVIHGLRTVAGNTRAAARAAGAPEDDLWPPSSRAGVRAVTFAGVFLALTCALLGAAMLAS